MRPVSCALMSKKFQQPPRAFRPRGLQHFLRRRHAVADGAVERAAILAAIAKHWTVASDVEVTLEANRPAWKPTASAIAAPPGSIAFRSACSARRRALKELGRYIRQAKPSMRSRWHAVFARYSFDLIYARPEQTVESWAAELDRAIAEAAEHLSLYQLTVEPETPFFALHAAASSKSPTAISRASFTTRRKRPCQCAGFRPTRFHHARPGAECRHISFTGAGRICRDWPRRPWPPRDRRAPFRNRDGGAPGSLVDAR